MRQVHRVKKAAPAMGSNSRPTAWRGPKPLRRVWLGLRHRRRDVAPFARCEMSVLDASCSYVERKEPIMTSAMNLMVAGAHRNELMHRSERWQLTPPSAATVELPGIEL